MIAQITFHNSIKKNLRWRSCICNGKKLKRWKSGWHKWWNWRISRKSSHCFIVFVVCNVNWKMSMFEKTQTPTVWIVLCKTFVKRQSSSWRRNRFKKRLFIAADHLKMFEEGSLVIDNVFCLKNHFAQGIKMRQRNVNFERFS